MTKSYSADETEVNLQPAFLGRFGGELVLLVSLVYQVFLICVV
jgi:hypothetical protein